MSHLFISYSHKDKQHLSTLLDWQKDKKFTDHQIWYDNIEGGDNWREEISSALDEAFAVVVIVTANSMQSFYCTYEWSYALGQGIPLLPLLFDDVPAKDFHAPLSAKQYLDCTSEIDANLERNINQYKSIPPQVKIINQMVHDAIELTHQRYFILTKLGKHITSRDDYIYKHTVMTFYEEANVALKTLNGLMLDKRFAFSGRQYRYCWRIIQFLEDFSDLQYEERSYYDPNNYFLTTLAPKFETEWLPAFKYFATSNWWERTTYKYFSFDFNDASVRLRVFGDIMRAFPDLNAIDAESLIPGDSNIHQNIQHLNKD